MGVVVGNISIVLTGVVAISVANTLRNVEERSDRLEGRTKI